MRILFIHNNFPAQFGALGQHLSRGGWDVTFATQLEGARAAGIDTVMFVPHRKRSSTIHPYAANYEQAVLNGQGFARRALELKQSGYTPDIVMAHSGWGPGLFVRDIWPDALYVGYFEWYYRGDGPDVMFMKHGRTSLDERCRARARNAAILSDLVACDFGIVPTRFQQGQFPDSLQNKLVVLHDGIDCAQLRPDPDVRLILKGLDLSGAREIVTYVARGMEPYRGFPEFMKSVELLLKQRPHTHVVIVGQDRVAYGRGLPEGDSFKTRALQVLDLDLDRIHFTGLLPRADYMRVLQASSVHVYLTVPFVLSWSMVEAMSAGCALVASDTAPVREFVDPSRGRLVDLRQPDQIADAIAALLDDPDRRAELGKRARAFVTANYDQADIYERKRKMLEAWRAG